MKVEDIKIPLYGLIHSQKKRKNPLNRLNICLNRLLYIHNIQLLKTHYNPLSPRSSSVEPLKKSFMLFH